MGWPANKVLSKGAAGSYSECGVWINSPVKIGDVYVAAVHQEQKCDYINGGQTHKSMGVSFSYDGLSWVNPITVLTSPEAPKMGTQSGRVTVHWFGPPMKATSICIVSGRGDGIISWRVLRRHLICSRQAGGNYIKEIGVSLRLVVWQIVWVL